MPSAGAPAEDGFYESETTADWDAGTDAAGLDRTRIVIRNATLSIVVENPAQAMNTISQMAEEMGGFVVVSNLYKTVSRNDREVPQADITVRVPAEQLNEAIEQIKALVEDPDTDILSENVSGQDITREYTDLSSQLRNLEQAEAQLREIMASATETDDVLAVHQQLTQIREQIEVIQGRIQYYDEAAALSAVEVRLQALAAIQPLEIGGWKPVGEARNAAQALIDTLQFLGSAAIWLLIYVLPVALVIFIPLRLLWVLFRRLIKGRAKKPAPAAEPPAPPTAA